MGGGAQLCVNALGFGMAYMGVMVNSPHSSRWNNSMVGFDGVVYEVKC